MADKKPGPVKPPIIDAKPRSASAPTSTDKPSTASDTAASPGTPDLTPDPKATGAQGSSKKPTPAAGPGKSGPADKGGAAQQESKKDDKSTANPQAASSSVTPRTTSSPLPVATLVATAIGGAIAGVAIAYGLAAAGLWPQAQADENPSLADLQSRIGEIEIALSQQAPQDVTAQIEAVTTELSARIDDVAAAEPQIEGFATQPDLDALGGQISDISARLDALAAGASGDEATEFADQLTDLAGQVSDLSMRFDNLEPQIDQWAPVIENAQTRLDDLDARIADQSAFDDLAADRDRVARLPAAVAALETAMASGSGFAAELAEVETLLPSLSVDANARALAGTGAPTTTTLLADFRSALPEILAARPRDANANWAQNLLDQAGAAIALRPTEGDSPQALVGAIETAIEAGDLATAQETFAQLPETMQQAAPGFADDLDTALAARTLLVTIRSAQSETPQAEAAQ